MSKYKDEFRIATLNCWGLPQPWPIGSAYRKYRFDRLIEALADSEYDVVTLQEVWSESDFLRISRETKVKFPFCHYFHSGFTGSGTCVLSVHPIVSTLLHRYSLNGFPHHVHRGDWFGGKIVGMVELSVKNASVERNMRVNVYTTHLHAEYNRKNDLYLPHRISQCFELAQFVRHTSQGVDFVILAGDFNIEPSDLGYHLILSIGQLSDAWECRPDSQVCLCSGSTSERPDNFFTRQSALKECPEGKRIDYVMFQNGKVGLELAECKLCFDKISEPKPMNYSDHTGVSATFVLNPEPVSESSSEQLRQIAFEKMFVEKSVQILEEGELRVLWDRRLYLAICLILAALVISSSGLELAFPYLTPLVSVGRFVFTLIIGFSLWHGFIGLTIEMKALKETKYAMRKLLKHTLS